MANGQPPARARDVISSPDPSTLTTEQLHDMERQLRREIECAAEILNVRLDGLVKEADERFQNIRELRVERFARVDTQFADLKELTDKMSDANATALSAALSAAKEAVTKSDTVTAEKIASMQALFATELNAVKATIALLMSRLDKGEGTTAGGMQQRTEARMSAGQMIGTIAACFAGATLLLGVLGFALRAH